ncbi:MAG: hypothetical protein JWM04_1142 [Verrucomicrobiales bacterium]|nr:hypothetical protein [Verrucomicrobiales bacterium]
MFNSGITLARAIESLVKNGRKPDRCIPYFVQEKSRRQYSFSFMERQQLLLTVDVVTSREHVMQLQQAVEEELAKLRNLYALDGAVQEK